MSIPNTNERKVRPIHPGEMLRLIVGGHRLRFDGPGPIVSEVGGVE